MTPKPVVLSQHARARAAQRGATDTEVADVVRRGAPKPADRGRLSAVLSFPFRMEHHGRNYESKDVVAVFVEEDARIVVVTVYVFFSQKTVPGGPP